MRRVEQRHDVREAVHREPDQLFLAPHLAVVAREAARPLAGAEPVHDHPREVARLEPLRPPTAKSAGAHAAIPSGVARSSASSSCAARADAATSCTRTTAAPCTKHQTVVASVASSRVVDRRVAERRGRGTTCATCRRAAAPRPAPRARAARRATRGCARSSSRSRCPGSASMRVGADAGRDRGVDARAQLVADLADDVVRSCASALHRARRAAHVHQRRTSRPRRRRRASMSGSAVPPETSFTIAAPGLERGRRDRAPSWCRCSPGPRLAADELPHDRQRRGAAPRRRRPASAPGRVDSPPTSSTAAPAAASARPCATAASASRVAAAVGEGVGRDVDDPHQRSPGQLGDGPRVTVRRLANAPVTARIGGLATDSRRQSGRQGPEQRHDLGPGRRILLEEAAHGRRDGERSRACARRASTCTDARPRSSRTRRAAASASTIASAICVVSRSCTCGRLANPSTRRASFDRPVMRPSSPGMYATCARPWNGIEVVLADASTARCRAPAPSRRGRPRT